MRSASAIVASRLRPFSMPSRAMSVKMIAATPASSKRCASSSAVSSRGLGPAFDRDLAVARVDADGDAAGKFLRGALHQRGIAHRRGADDDARDALGEPGFDGLEVADAAAELHRHGDRLEHRLDRRALTGLPAKAPSRSTTCRYSKPCAAKLLRLRGRIEVEHGRARHVALLEPHALAVLQIDRGKKDHGFHFRKFAISARPKRWLFSGWNCVPTRCPCRRWP